MGAEFDTMLELLDYRASNIVQKARDEVAEMLAPRPEAISRAAIPLAIMDPTVTDVAEELAMFVVDTEMDRVRRANATEMAERFFHENHGLAWLVVAFLCAKKELKTMREVAECIPPGAPIPASAAATFVWLGIDSEEEIRKHVAPIEVAEDVPPQDGQPVASDPEEDKI